MDLRVNQTGIRNGEFITSSPSGKQNKGMVMQIRGLYPPDIQEVKKLNFVTLRDVFNVIPFFTNMSAEDRKEWLIDNSIDMRKVYLEDVELWVKIVKIGSNNFLTKTLDKDIIDGLLRGNSDDPEGYWRLTDVYNLFPRKPGSKARKTTLVFRPSNWSLMIPKTSVSKYTGMYIDLDDGILSSGTIETGTIETGPIGTGPKKIYKIELESRGKAYMSDMAIMSSSRGSPLTEDKLFSMASKYVDIDVMNQIKDIICWFPPSMHKSLIQKLIRTRCQQVEYGGKTYDASATLLTSLSLLFLNPGVFVPNIRRFVTGMESSTKRLAVSICEDSYTTNFNALLSLYAASLVAQTDRNWLPTDKLLDEWFRLAIQAQTDSRLFDYDFHNYQENITQFDPLSVSYLILAEIRSFKTDIDMMGSIAQNFGRAAKSFDSRMTIMPILQAVDHHAFTEIAYYLPYTGTPYEEVFGNIWKYVSAVNPRKEIYKNYVLTMENEDFVKNVRRSQRDVWISKMYQPQNRPTTELTTDFSYTLDPSWLAGMIGPIEIKLSKSVAIVVLKVDNIYNMTAVKKPQRDSKAANFLTDEEIGQAVRKAKLKLSKGIKLSNVPSTLPLFKDSTVTLVEDRYIITVNGQNYLWSDIINLQYVFPVHQPLPGDSVYNSLLYTGDGIEAGAEVIETIFSKFNRDVIRRLSTFLTGYKSSIELGKISRDGTGTYYQVFPEDTAVNHILSYISVKYPAALVKCKSGFKVKVGPLLWTIRDTINQRMAQTVNFDKKWKIPLPETRKRWEHQIDSYNQMVARNEAGKKGHLMWITVGLGKTMITLDYLAYLIESGKMPSYCVYSLPASAIDNIQVELDRRGIPHKLLDGRKASKDTYKRVDPYIVCLIKHDHLRLGGLDDTLKRLAKDMVFIVDEFHKTLGKSIRTSLALEIARLSYDFVGMTGTIIKDTNYDELIQWLEQIVEFEVTEKNYWVAIGALVSRKVCTKVVVDRQMIEISLPPDLAERYYSLVPEKLGGHATQIKFNEAVNLCYEAVTREMVKDIYNYVMAGEGVFVVAKDITHQKVIQKMLIQQGLSETAIHLFEKDNQITLTAEYDGPIKVVITTKRHAEGYTLTKFRIMIMSVYFTNQATRDQLEGRINRIGQESDEIKIHIYHTGILTYINNRYEKARTLAQALKGFAAEVGIDYDLDL